MIDGIRGNRAFVEETGCCCSKETVLISLSLVAIALTVAAIWAYFAGSPFALGLGLLAGGFFAVTFILSENWNPREHRPFLHDYAPEKGGGERPPEKPRRGGGAPAPQYLPLPPECDIVRGHLCEAAPPIPKNYRNSCYIASSLGVLLSMRLVREELLKADGNGRGVPALRAYLDALQSGQKPDPQSIREALRIKGFGQEDALEKIWRPLLEFLYYGKNHRYQIQRTLANGRTSQGALDAQNILALSIQQDQSLQHLLNQEMGGEVAPGHHELVDGQQVTHFHHLYHDHPPFLSITLKRFGGNGDRARFRAWKDERFVSVEEQLSIDGTHFTDGREDRYQLDGFVVHRGRSLHGGHYVGYIRTQGEWYLLDDLHPHPEVITREQALRAAQTAYLFYYSQIPPHPLA